MYVVFLTCTVAPGRRMNSLENMFLRKLKPLKTSSENKDQKYIYLICQLKVNKISPLWYCYTESHVLVFQLAERSTL